MIDSAIRLFQVVFTIVADVAKRVVATVVLMFLAIVVIVLMAFTYLFQMLT